MELGIRPASIYCKIMMQTMDDLCASVCIIYLIYYIEIYMICICFLLCACGVFILYSALCQGGDVNRLADLLISAFTRRFR